MSKGVSLALLSTWCFWPPQSSDDSLQPSDRATHVVSATKPIGSGTRPFITKTTLLQLPCRSLAKRALQRPEIFHTLTLQALLCKTILINRNIAEMSDINILWDPACMEYQVLFHRCCWRAGRLAYWSFPAWSPVEGKDGEGVMAPHSQPSFPTAKRTLLSQLTRISCPMTSPVSALNSVIREGLARECGAEHEGRVANGANWLHRVTFLLRCQKVKVGPRPSVSFTPVTLNWSRIFVAAPWTSAPVFALPSRVITVDNV